MKSKKWNARLAIFTFFLLLIHEGYQLFAYLTFYYNSTISAITGFSLAGCFLAHGILSAISVFVLHDAKIVTYKKRNCKTVLQRASAVVVILLLPVHIFSFSLLQRSETAAYAVIEALQIVYYAALTGHIAVSIGNALVTLGLLADIGKKRVLDTVVFVVCALLFIAVCVIITMGHAKLFRGA